jgi:membrane protease YdiL (CAAX protease family)
MQSVKEQRSRNQDYGRFIESSGHDRALVAFPPRVAASIRWARISVLVGVLWNAGLLAFDGMLLHGFTAWGYALACGLVFLFVGFSEESLLRGYLQYTLTRGIGFWWAALLVSIAFALGHLGNGGESVPSRRWAS